MLDVMRSRSPQKAIHPSLRALASAGPAVVTGAGSGIGRALAVASADAGFDPTYDLDKNDVIGLGDFLIFAAHFGESL